MSGIDLQTLEKWLTTTKQQQQQQPEAKQTATKPKWWVVTTSNRQLYGPFTSQLDAQRAFQCLSPAEISEAEIVSNEAFAMKNGLITLQKHFPSISTNTEDDPTLHLLYRKLNVCAREYVSLGLGLMKDEKGEQFSRTAKRLTRYQGYFDQIITNNLKLKNYKEYRMGDKCYWIDHATCQPRCGIFLQHKDCGDFVEVQENMPGKSTIKLVRTWMFFEQ